MRPIHGDVTVKFHYAVHFTHDLFASENSLLREVLTESAEANSNGHGPAKRIRVMWVVDEAVAEALPVRKGIAEYFETHKDVLELAGEPTLLPGGERVKNEPEHVLALQTAVNETGLDRHSYMAVIGGGALLDLAGYAAATSHRGIRLIRVPTTTLSQNDSGVGVKNGINYFGKKNFIGTFAPAWAVLNDSRFLETLPEREWRNGIAEAVKVSLIKDADFFETLEQDATALAARDMDAMQRLIHRCAELHVQHICTSGDPFEMGSSRPLDFGHWSAHKLEQITSYQLRHGEAVAIGLGLDVTYSYLKGWLSKDEWQRVLNVLSEVGFSLYHEELSRPEVFNGLREFREHLGGELTIQMLRTIGEGFNVHEVDESLMQQSIALLQEAAQTASSRELTGVA